MQRIKLSKDEKRLFRNILSEVSYWPSELTAERLAEAVSSLEDKRLIRVAWESGHVPCAAEVTERGNAYFLNNPKLTNPVDWKWIIGTGIALIAAIAATASAIILFIACSSKL